MTFILFRSSFRRESEGKHIWDPMVDRISGRLNGWKKVLLSLGVGRRE